MQIIAQIYHKQYRIFFLLIIFTVFTSNAYSQLVPDFRVNDDSTGFWNVNSAIDSDEKGNFIVVWEDYRRNGRPNIYAQKFEENAQQVGINFLVNENLDTAGFPDVVIYNEKYVGICWLEVNSLVNYSSRVKFRIFDYTTLQPITPPILINDSISNFDGYPRVGVDQRGIFIITWEYFDYDIYFQRFDTLGNKIGINEKVNDDTGSYAQRHPDITVLPDGRFVITWDDSRPPGNGLSNIYMQMYNQDGNKIGVNTIVNDNLNPLDTRYEPKISSDTSGRFVIGWSESNTQLDGFVQLYNPDGSKRGSNIGVGLFGNEIVTALDKRANGDLIVIYGNSGVNYPQYCQRFDTSGQYIGTPYLLTTYPVDDVYARGVSIFEDRVIATWYDDRTGNFDVYCNIRSFQNPDSTVGINQILNEVPEEFKLFQNYPNPFNPETNILFNVPLSGNFRLTVYDITGREIEVLFDGKLNPGSYEFKFNGSRLTSGIYFYRLQGESITENKKMILLK